MAGQMRERRPGQADVLQNNPVGEGINAKGTTRPVTAELPSAPDPRTTSTKRSVRGAAASAEAWCTICGGPITWTNTRTTHITCEIGWKPTTRPAVVPPTVEGREFSPTEARLPANDGAPVVRSDGRAFSWWLTDLVEREARR